MTFWNIDILSANRASICQNDGPHCMHTFQQGCIICKEHFRVSSIIALFFWMFFNLPTLYFRNGHFPGGFNEY